MISIATDLQSEGVSLEIKTLGETTLIAFSSISDAADEAVRLISAGTAIPKSIKLGDKVVMSESDINTYWEQSRSSHV